MTVLAEPVYLDSYLAPLAIWLARGDVTDIYINRPQEVWIETLGGATECHAAPALTGQVLQRLARQIAACSAQGISREAPLLAASLPDGSRVQVVLPPATRGEVALAIRKHVSAGLALDAWRGSGAIAAPAAERHPAEWRAKQGKEVIETLRAAVRARRNILISGGTSSGKTTFLNALLREIPADERLILIEDTPELQLVHPNAVGLIAARGHMGEADVSAEDLLIAALRMRPDRIVLGEIRGGEAMTFLRAINTGHPGSLSTIHADSPERAMDQLALLVLQSGNKLSWENVVQYITKSIDIIVQLSRTGGIRSVESALLLSK